MNIGLRRLSGTLVPVDPEAISVGTCDGLSFYCACANCANCAVARTLQNTVEVGTPEESAPVTLYPN